jgi:hypothetical protein
MPVRIMEGSSWLCTFPYTTETEGLVNQIFTRPSDVDGRGEKTRTSGLYVPNVARYQLRHTPIKNSVLPTEFTTLCVATPRFVRHSFSEGGHENSS